MTTAQQLNTQFGINGQLIFVEDVSGLIVAQIDNARGSAKLCLQGAHLMSWQPKSQAVPVVWLSRDTKPAVGKSIRGGAPRVSQTLHINNSMKELSWSMIIT